MPHLLPLIGLAAALMIGGSFIAVIACLPHWVANAADGDLAMLGILDDGAR